MEGLRERPPPPKMGGFQKNEEDFGTKNDKETYIF